MKQRMSWTLTAMLALLWCFLSGAFNVANFLMGLLVGAVTVSLLRPFVPWNPSLVAVSRKIPAFLRYTPRFLYELCKANLQVVYLALHPKMPIRPGIVALETRHRSPLGTTLLANSITLTPGTLTMDVSEDGKTLYIHTLDISDPEEVRERIRRGLEDYTVEVAE
ncbi:MAG: Na+/H+ antiporter subunit E [Candidatus Methylomirabilales bacterium]